MIDYDEKEFLWCEKYRPKTVAEMILPQRMKDTFTAIVTSGELSNTILAGGPGLGKCLSGEELITIEISDAVFKTHFSSLTSTSVDVSHDDTVCKSITLSFDTLFFMLGATFEYDDIPIGNIPEMFVRSPDGIRKRINYLMKKSDTKLKLVFDNGTIIHCGEHHIMQSSQGLGFAKDISDCFNALTGNYCHIVNKISSEYGPVYDIAIDDPHLYVTPNGFVHHNTTLAKALCNEMGLDYLLINASESGNIDTIRTTIRAYASTMSFTSKYKVVILDEADYLNACFAGEQKIKVIENGNILEKTILELLGRDEILTISYDFDNEQFISTNATVFETGNRPVYRVTMDDSSEIVCTEDHPFFTETGETAHISGGELFALSVAETYTYKPNMFKIAKIEYVNHQKVYDISVDHPSHNFILANGVLAHNSSSQPALRGFIEEFSRNCRFVFTANYLNRIIEPLRSRCPPIEFSFSKQEKQQMVVEFDHRIKEILKIEQVEFDKKELAQIIIKYFPDFRRIINVLQHHTSQGSLESGVITNINNDAIKELFSYLKDPTQWKEMRKWVVDHHDYDFNMIARSLFEKADEHVKAGSIPQLVLTLAQYDYKQSFCADKELNTVAAMTELMSECEFL